MTDASTSAIWRRLIEKWRKRASDRGYEPYAQWAFNRCADELDTALRADALAPPEPQGAKNETTKAESAKDETDRRRMASLVRDVPEVGAVGGMVAGDRMERPIYDFVRACERHLSDEQTKPNPDNALIGVLCDAVRLTRELAPPRADALAPAPQKDDLAHDAKVQAVHLRLTQRANELHSAHVALEEAAEEIVDLKDQLADALAPPEPPDRSAHPSVEFYESRAKWYREGCDGLEDGPADYRASGDLERDAAADILALCSRVRDLEAALAPPEPTRNEWRLDDRGDLDDVVVNDVVTFRLERMHDDHVWGRVYRRDGSQTDFNLHSERPITLTYEHDGFPAPPRADALAAVPTERPFLASVLEALVDPERTDFELRQLDLGRDRPVWLAALRRELAPLLGGPQ